MFAYQPKRCNSQFTNSQDQDLQALFFNKSDLWKKCNPIIKLIDLGDGFMVRKELHSYLNVFTGIYCIR